MRRIPFLLLLFSLLPSPAPAQPLPDDARRWVDSTLASLSLREKAGQLVVGWTGGEYVAMDSPEMDSLLALVERDGIGGFVISIGLPHSYAAKLNALQRRARVPLLVMTDLESGPGMRLNGAFSLPHLLPMGGGTVFPPVMALGAIGSDSLAYEVGKALAREGRAVGLHVTLAPVLDVNSNPRNPIINTRSFGEDPVRVSALAAAYVRGVREGGLLTVGKHFPGHGDTETDSHLGLPAIRADRARLDSVELPPYRAALAAGLDGMLVGHIALTGLEGADAEPASLSRGIVTGLLRGELGFGGLVMTDALNMGAVLARHGPVQPAVLALEAGADVLLQPPLPGAAVDAVVDAVRAGRISPARLDESVRRVLEWKARAGLHRAREVPLEAVDEAVGTRAHRALADTVARRSITLVRDEGGLVPMVAREPRRVLSITYAAPADLNAGRVFDAELSYRGFRVERARVDERTHPAVYDSLRARAAAADVVVASAYVHPVDRRGSVGAAGGYAALVEELARGGKPVVAVSFGSPYLLDFHPGVPTYLLAWGGADVSQRAAARALTGLAPITGTLPVSLPPHHARGAGLRRDARFPDAP
ncbi:MAG TPA: glycoside hydrolase family 3 N-terminal domain-containing protein [Longimicrobium sp.]|nr:glycoside hydrolase family 3 N-terminal domain-containing protein [Longimicrobium sp.]